jgi:hypothetical protein
MEVLEMVYFIGNNFAFSPTQVLWKKKQKETQLPSE